jgi:hypothetical protein
MNNNKNLFLDFISNLGKTAYSENNVTVVETRRDKNLHDVTPP